MVGIRGVRMRATVPVRRAHRSVLLPTWHGPLNSTRLSRVGTRVGLVAATLASALILQAGHASKAQCVDTGGTIVVCGANDTDGFVSPVDLTSLLVAAGVTVDDTGTGGTGAAGGTQGAVIEVLDPAGGFGPPQAGLGEFVNDGTVRKTGGNGSALLVEGPLGSFLNKGTIEGIGTDVVFVADVVTGDFVNTGTISNLIGAEAVDLNAIGGRFLNSGEIRGFGTAVDIDAGTIAGGFTNSGLISGLIGNGVSVASGAADQGSFENVSSGTISGSTGFLSGDGVEHLINAGTLTGISGTAVSLGGNDDTLTLTTGSVVNGTINGGIGTDSAILSGSGSEDDDFTGFETLSVQASGTWSLGGNAGFSNAAVHSGTLLANGFFAAPFTVMSGGTLGGIGLIVGNTEVKAGGTLAPGAPFGSLTLIGDLVLNPGATYAVNAILTAGTSTFTNVSGTAALAGTVVAQVSNPTLAPQLLTILLAGGGITNNGLGLVASPALQAELVFLSATDVALAISVDFTVPGSGLNANQASLAKNLNTALAGGGGGLDPVFDGLLNGVFDATGYADALDQLSPEVYLSTETATLFAAEEFTDTLFSCPVAGAAGSAIAERPCIWIQPEGRVLDLQGDDDRIGFDEDVTAISAGGQIALAPDWFAGFALSYEDGEMQTASGAESDSERFSAGAVIKYQNGPTLLAAGISGGVADYNTTRRMSFGSFSSTATSSHDVSYISGQARAAHLFDYGIWYAKPLVDVNLTHVDRDELAESGSAASLVVSGGDDTYLSVTPAIEWGANLAQPDGSFVRPFLTIGTTFFDDTDQSLTASFSGAPDSVGTFLVESEFDDVFADIEAGITAFRDDRSSVSIAYRGRIGDDTEQHGVFVKGSLAF